MKVIYGQIGTIIEHCIFDISQSGKAQQKIKQAESDILELIDEYIREEWKERMVDYKQNLSNLKEK